MPVLRTIPWMGRGERNPEGPYGTRGETKDVVQIDSSDPSSSAPVMMAVAFAVIAVDTRYDISNVVDPPAGGS